MRGYVAYNESKSFSSLYHLVSKEYVDNAVTSLGARYYMLNSSSGIGGYKLTSLDVPSGSEATLSYASLSDNDYLEGWISPTAGEPDQLIEGIYDWRIYAQKTSGTKDVQLYWKLYERLSNGTEVLLGTSIYSGTLTGNNNSFIIPLSITGDMDIADDSYVVGKIYAHVLGSGSAPSINLYVEGDKDSHWLIPMNLQILNNQYLRLDGSNNMTGNINMDNNDIINVGDINGTNIHIDNLYADRMMINMNATSHNITDVECIIWSSGGFTCSGS